MPTARSVRCRKCHTGYDHHKHASCPRCGAPSKPTATTPAVAGGPPASKPKKERMTPLMKVAMKGEGLVYGQPSILEPVKTSRKGKHQTNNAPIIISSIVGVAVIIGIALAMRDSGDDKKRRKSPSPAQQMPAEPAPLASANPTPPLPEPTPPPAATEPTEPIDPLDAEAQGRRQPPSRPGPGPDDAAPPGGDPAPPRRDPPPRPPAEWKVDPAVKAELEPKLREMSDWPTSKIEEEKRAIAARGAEVIPALIELIDNEDEMSAKWACEILQSMTGRNLGVVMGTTRDDRREISAAWKAWYQANASSYDAAKARTEEQILDLGIKWAREYKKAPFPEAEEVVVRRICAEADKEIVSGLVMAVGFEDQDLARSAHNCLARLTGQDMGDVPETADGLKEVAAKWAAWWKSNQGSWQFPSR